MQHPFACLGERYEVKSQLFREIEREIELNNGEEREIKVQLGIFS